MGCQYFFRYSRTVPKEKSTGTLAGANIAFLNVPELDPSTDTGNLRIVDRSYLFPENNILFANSIVNFNSGSITNDAAYFLITDEYGNATTDPTPLPIDPTIDIRPLWYKHVFSNYVPGRLASGIYSVIIVDSNGIAVPLDRYKIYYINGVPAGIYTDLINTLDNTYTLVYMSGGREVRRLLSVEPIFERSETTFALTEKQYKRTIDPSDNRYHISVFSSSKQYSLKNIGTTKIYAKHPVQVSTSVDPWYLQIFNGSFKRIAGGNAYEYFIPEFYSQATYNPKLPFKFQIMEKPIFVDNTTLQLKQTPLPRVSDGIQDPIHIYIRKSSDRTDIINNAINANGGILNPTEAFLQSTPTNTPSILWWELVVDDIDRNSGLVKISGIKEPNGSSVYTLTSIDNIIYASDEIVACYYYNEEEYTFTSKNFNPLSDINISTGGTSIYMGPARAYPLPGSTLPTTLSTAVTNSTTLGFVTFDDNEMIGGVTLLDSFYAANPLLLEIARVFVGSSSTIYDIVNGNLIDTRIKGGIIVDELPADVIAVIESNTYGMYRFRNWDSAVYPGYSVVIFKLPSYLLNDNYEASGTPLSGDDLVNRMRDIREDCKKHLSTGEFPIVRFYDNTTGTITSDRVPLDRMDL